MTRSSEMVERLRRLGQESESSITLGLALILGSYCSNRTSTGANRPIHARNDPGHHYLDLPIRFASLEDHDDAIARSLEAEAAAEDEKHGPYDLGLPDEDDLVDTPKRSPVTYVQPQPTLELPPNYHFRTTELGYPIFRHMILGYSEYRRASMTTSTGFLDPRITAFVDLYTYGYSALQLWELRVHCGKRGLPTYGKKEKLVERLVEQALRDASRGWSEMFDTVRGVRRSEPPPLPDMIRYLD